MIPTVEPDAQAEIDAALAASPDPGRLLAAINDALAAIGANPQIGAQVSRSRARQYLLGGRLPYSVIYTEADGEIRVYALPHHRRRTGYWKNRLPKT